MTVRIPGVESVGEVGINVSTPLARVNVSQAGRGLTMLGRAMERREDERANYEANKARTGFLSDYTKNINSFDERDDYENFVNDFNRDAEQSLADAAENIRDAQQRQQFIDDGRLKIVQGAEKIRDMAFNKERDVERGTLVNDLETAQNLAIEADDEDISDIIGNTINRF